MARRAGRQCSVAGCPNIASGSFCDEHMDEQRQDDRPSAARRGYGHGWRRLRRMALARSPLCADPFGIHKANGEVVIAVDVHHVETVSEGNPTLTSLDKLETLCHSCHSRITATHGGRGAAT